MYKNFGKVDAFREIFRLCRAFLGFTSLQGSPGFGVSYDTINFKTQ